jgi:Ca-activated chloride channel family protein
MDLLWPWFLLLLAIVPLAIAAYVWMLRRRRRFTVRYSSLSLVRAALPRTSRWRRHLPFALFLLALTSLVIALGRPVAIASVPAGTTTVILSMDVSRSMCSTDVPPNRLVAAQEAALSFIRRQPATTQIGIVAFSGFAAMLQAPTTDQEALQSIIESLTTGRRTAVGSGILKAIDAIAESDPSIAPSVNGSGGPAPSPVPNGAYAPAIIVLLTDGASNQGPPPVEAAQQAVDRGLRVYTIGYGTASGGLMDCSGQFGIGGQGSQFGGDPFGGGGMFMEPYGGGGGNFRRGIDEDTLKKVADMTGGEYYSAESADELQMVFQELPMSLIMRHEVTEISVAFAAIGALFAGVAIALSMLWNPLP